jgi:hypothetical protein
MAAYSGAKSAHPGTINAQPGALKKLPEYRHVSASEAIKARPEATIPQPGAAKDRNEARWLILSRENSPRVMGANPRAMETHTGALKAYPEAKRVGLEKRSH